MDFFPDIFDNLPCLRVSQQSIIKVAHKHLSVLPARCKACLRECYEFGHNHIL